MPSSPRAAILLAPGFEEIEAIIPIDILRRASFQVTSLGTEPNPITASRGTRHLADEPLSPEHCDRLWDILILPGGVEGTKHLRENPLVKKMILNHFQSQKWIAAICAAPSILIDLQLLKAHPYTLHPSLHTTFSSPLLQTHQRVVVSKPFITSLAAGSALEFSYEIVRQLSGESTLQTINAGVCFP